MDRTLIRILILTLLIGLSSLIMMSQTVVFVPDPTHPVLLAHHSGTPITEYEYKDTWDPAWGKSKRLSYKEWLKTLKVYISFNRSVIGAWYIKGGPCKVQLSGGIALQGVPCDVKLRSHVMGTGQLSWNRDRGASAGAIDLVYVRLMYHFSPPKVKRRK